MQVGTDHDAESQEASIESTTDTITTQASETGASTTRTALDETAIELRDAWVKKTGGPDFRYHLHVSRGGRVSLMGGPEECRRRAEELEAELERRKKA